MMVFKPLFKELGLNSVLRSSLDAKLLILTRFTRFFAFGGSTIVLALYLHSLNIPDVQIGLFFSLTLVGDLLSFGLTLLADGIGRRVVLGGGALLMCMSGIVFGCSQDWRWLLAASIIGIISPNGREIGPFTAIEESALAHLTQPERRSDVFAWYTLIGSGGSAAGKLATGWMVQYLKDVKQWAPLQAYKVVFLAYACLGLVNVLLTCCLSGRVELHSPKKLNIEEEEESLLEGIENRESLDHDAVLAILPLEEKRPLFPTLSKESRSILWKLSILFAIDSLASGLVPASLVTYFYYKKFDVQPGELGTIFFFMGILSAISSLVAVSLSKRIGLVRTMVFTHLPSAIALSLIPIPSHLKFSLVFLVIRSSLASMDIAPKAAFLSVIILPSERTAVMGFISVVRTASQSCGPLITGILAGKNRFWVAFVVAGSLKATYDLGLLAGFQSRKTDVDRADEATKIPARDIQGREQLEQDE